MDPRNVLIEAASAYDNGGWYQLLSESKKIRNETKSWTVQNEFYLLFAELNIAGRAPLSKKRLIEMQNQLRKLLQNIPKEECIPETIPAPLVVTLTRYIQGHLGTRAAIQFLDEIAGLVVKKDMDSPEFLAALSIEKATLSPENTSAETIAELKKIISTNGYQETTQALAFYSLANLAISEGAYPEALNLLNQGLAKIDYLKAPSLVKVLLLRTKGLAYEHLKNLEQADRYYLESMKASTETTPEGAPRALWNQHQKELIKKSFLKNNKHTKLLQQLQQM